MAKPRSADNSNLDEIISLLDILAEYKLMGIVVTGEVRSSGFVECQSMAKGERDAKPSAWINTKTGQYGDSTEGATEQLSLWDFSVKYGGKENFKASVKYYGDKVGVKSGKKTPIKPEDMLEFEEWTDAKRRLLKHWCKTKPGVTPEAFEANGGRIGHYPCRMKGGVKVRGNFQCALLPIYPVDGLSGAPPCGWIAWNITGQPLLKYKKKGEKPEPIKMKVVDGSVGGLVGKFALDRMLASDEEELIVKTEGPTDMLTFFGIIPPELRHRVLVLCNANGATEDCKRFASALIGRRVGITHDLDQPGSVGYAKWSEDVAPSCREFIIGRLPGEVQPNHGPDLRDYITGRGAFEANGPLLFDEVMDLFDKGEIVRPATPTPAAMAPYPRLVEGSETIPFQPAMSTVDPLHGVNLAIETLKMIQLEVCGEHENGAIVVFAYHETRRKYFELRDIDRLTYAKLIQIAGSLVLSQVEDSDDEPAADRISIAQVKRSIAILAGAMPLHDRSFHEAGCWQVSDEKGHPTQEIVLVGAKEALHLDSAGKLTEYHHPRIGGLHLRFGGDSWYDPGLLKSYVHDYTPAWASEVIEETSTLFESWRWQAPEGPQIVTGLVLATWVQTIWAWRPQVGVSGKTNSGKSMLFETMGMLFGNLAERSSKSSAAGIRQTLQTSARICLLDEAENSKHRDEILAMQRLASRGDSIQMGTADQRGKRFFLRHIIWSAATELGHKEAPDRNRHVVLELLLPKAEKAGQLVLKSPEYLGVLGQKLLAIAIKNVLQARELAIRLKATRIEGVNSRVIESMSVPAAILATARGLNVHEAESLLRAMLAGSGPQVNLGSDECRLLAFILKHLVRLDHGGNRSVGQMVLQHDGDAVNHLAKVGIAVALNRRGPRPKVFSSKPPEKIAKQFLFIDYEDVAEKILKRTTWEGKSIETLLGRLGTRCDKHVDGKMVTGIAIPLKDVYEQHFGRQVVEVDGKERIVLPDDELIEGFEGVDDNQTISKQQEML